MRPPDRRDACPGAGILRRARGAAIAALAVAPAVPALAGCGEGPPDAPAEAAADVAALADALYLAPASRDFSEHPELLARLRSDPHAYFRFLNLPFSRLVCDRFVGSPEGDPEGGLPLASLHGDAHVEQYAVTDRGRGLTDFDDSSRGPAALDLLRFGTSLRIAARRNGWGDEEEGVHAALVGGYRSGLREPEREVAEPSFVRRLRAGFVVDPRAHLEWAESLMEPLPPDVEAEVREAVRALAGTLLGRDRFVSAAAFEPVRLGRLRLGVGSGLDAKYLVRLRGATDDPADDDVLELKRVRNLEAIPCIRAEPDDPLRVLMGESQLTYRPFRLLGYVRLADGFYWTHAWVANYVEVDADGTLRAPAELAELAFDAGRQLGLGHFKLTDPSVAAAARTAQLAWLERSEDDLVAASRLLAEAALRAWGRFVDATGGIG